VRPKNSEKRLLSFVVSVRMEQLGPYWTDYLEILYLSIFRKSGEKFKNNGSWHDHFTFVMISRPILFQTRFVQNTKTSYFRFFFSKILPFMR